MNAGVEPGLDPVREDKPRMTAADADARFAALVAEHRAGKKPSSRGAASASSGDRGGTYALVLVFCVGVAAGALFHVKPLLAIILGVPTIVFAHVVYKRSRTRAESP